MSSVRLARQDTVLDEHTQAVGEDRPGRAGGALEVVEAASARMNASRMTSIVHRSPTMDRVRATEQSCSPISLQRTGVTLVLLRSESEPSYVHIQNSAGDS